MSRRGRVAAVGVAALTLTLGLASCSSTSASPTPTASSIASSDLHGLPVTFTGASGTVKGVINYAVGANGWAATTLVGSKLRLTYYDTAGHALWSGSLGDKPSAIYVVQDGGKDWIVARSDDTFSIYDSQAQGQSVKPSHHVAVGGATVVASPTRLLLVGATPSVLDPAAGVLTEVALPADETAVAATSDGILVNRGDTLSGLWSDNGGWSEKNVATSRTAKTAAPRFIGESNGLVAVAWGREVAIQRLTDGTVIAHGGTVPQGHPSAIAATDGTVAIVGDQVFTAGTSKVRDLPEGFAPTSAFEGVVYGTVNGSPAALDSLTLKALTPKAPLGAPAAIATWRSGFFASASSENGTFSVTVAPLRALDSSR